MPGAPIPALFDRVPPGLFGPFGGALAELYWSILSRLYQLEFEGEPYLLVKGTTVDLVEEVLRASPSWTERLREDPALEEEPASDKASEPVDAEGGSLRLTARRLLSRLERAGWFHFEFRASHGQVLCFYPYAARILESLVRVARDEQPVFQGYAHAIASLLRPDAFAPKPGVALHQARRQTLEMVRELKILERNISVFIQRMLDGVESAAGVLEESLEHYRQAVMANYHRLKTIENLFKWRAEIIERIDAIERSEPLLEAASRWYAEQFTLDLDGARAQVRADLGLLRTRFESIPQIASDIDVRNARFSGAALRKLMYLVRQDHRTEGHLQLLVERLARDEAPDLDFEVFRCELLGSPEGFLYTAPTRRAKPEARPLAERPPLDTESLRRALAASLHRPFARKQVDAYVAHLLHSREKVPLSEVALEGDEDYARLIFICAYGLDGRSSFRLHVEEGRQGHRGPYLYPEGRLEAGRRRR